MENRLVTGARELGINLSASQVEQFRTYTDLLLEWNTKVNLTRITSPEDIVLKHYLDSLTCLKVAEFQTGDTVADVGTGAGFPGVPISIARPDVKVVLIDATRKRLAFLEEVKRAVYSQEPNPSLRPRMHTVQLRAEEAGRQPDHRERYDIVVARAVAEMRVLAEYCLPLTKTGGVFIAMKGPDVQNELTLARPGIGSLGGGKSETIHLRLPGSDLERCLIVIKKVKPTPEQFPRHGSRISQKPL